MVKKRARIKTPSVKTAQKIINKARKTGGQPSKSQTKSIRKAFGQ